MFDDDAIVTQNDILAPPIVFLSNFFHSQSASQTQSFTASGIADPVFDALIAEAVKVTTLEEMATACRALDRVLLWGFYQIPLDAIAPFRIVYWNKLGRPGTGRHGGLQITVSRWLVVRRNQGGANRDQPMASKRYGGEA